MATATSSFLPMAAALRRWRAPPRTLSQCTVMVLTDCFCSRYTPTFGTPVSGSLVITSPRVMTPPASPGQGLIRGMLFRSTASPSNTCCLQGGRRSRSGLAFTRSQNTRANCLVSPKPFGGLGCCRRASRSPSSSSCWGCSRPILHTTRSTVPSRFTATGMEEPITFSNTRPGPPLANTRSAMAASSRSGSTGAVMRLSCPRSSSNWIKARRSRVPGPGLNRAISKTPQGAVISVL